MCSAESLGERPIFDIEGITLMTFIDNFNRTLGRKASLAAGAAVLTLAGIVSASADTPAHNHITICHRTGSASNPYIVISPDVEGVIEGHLDHEQTGNGLGGDIIPAFTYNGVTYSKNLDTVFPGGATGAMIAARGCDAPSEATPTPTPPPTTPTPPAPVPEPMTIMMFGTGLASIGFAARRRFGKKGTEEGSTEK